MLFVTKAKHHSHIDRGGGTGLADPAAAGPKLNRNPQFKFFCC